MEQLVMNRKERERLVVFSRVKDKELPRAQAAEVLGISLRQAHRLYRRYVAEGDKGLVHRARGKPSVRKIDQARQHKALELYRSTYRGFGPTLLAEKLGPDHGVWVSHDTVRRWLIGEGLLERCRKGRRSRRRRTRKERFGQMLQMDGSHHLWLEDRGSRCCLMVIIDDATGQMRGRFYPGETLFAAMDLFGRWCAEFGVPQSLYVDRAGIYRADREPTLGEIKNHKQPLTQFGRAMKELDVRLILAKSPQAKGRVERANGTLQDRLVKEMRLAKINGLEQANAWLDQGGFFAQLSGQFEVRPADAADAHRPVVLDLSCVLCVKEKRSVSLDSCLQWQGQTLQLKDARASLKQVELWQQMNGTLLISDGGKRLAFAPWTPPPKLRRIVKNNKVHKPTAKQQFSLRGSNPRRTELAGT
jgi:transposase